MMTANARTRRRGVAPMALPVLTAEARAKALKKAAAVRNARGPR
ncbi:hypothetical protein ACFQ71_39240 [Streptomyces sp. NPDC056534]